jgi:hypothetical protein
MAKNIRSISITDEQNKWLDEHPEVSLSKISQFSIENQIKVEELSPVREIKERLAKMSEKIKEFYAYLEKKGLLDEYLKGEN